MKKFNFLNEEIGDEQLPDSLEATDDLTPEELEALANMDFENEPDEDDEFFEDLDEDDDEQPGEEIDFEDLEDELDAEELTESKFSTTKKIVTKTRSQKIAKAGQRAALELAKDAQDPVYRKYRKLRNAEIKLRKKLEKKYGPKARAVARKMATEG